MSSLEMYTVFECLSDATDNEEYYFRAGLPHAVNVIETCSSIQRTIGIIYFKRFVAENF